MKSTVFLIFLFFTLTSATAQESLTKEISYEYLDKLISVCKSNYPRTKAYQDRVSMAALGVKRAKLSYFDIFSLGYIYSPANNTTSLSPSFFGGYQFGFFANVGSLLQKPSLIKQAKGEHSATQHELDAFQLTMETEVRKRYITYIQKIAVLRIKYNSLLDVESMLTNIRHKFEKGEDTLENYNRALLMQADHAQSIIDAEGEMLIAKSNLEEVVGQKLENIK
jgi:outer membrane protein TolC